MATINIGDILIPQADAPDVLAALQAYFASNGIPNPTQAQCLEYMRQADIQFIKGITRQWRAKQAPPADPALS